MGFRVGDWVELTEEGKAVFQGRARLRRNKGFILNESRFDDCYRVEWDGLATPETIHNDLIKLNAASAILAHGEQASDSVVSKNEITAKEG